MENKGKLILSKKVGENGKHVYASTWFAHVYSHARERNGSHQIIYCLTLPPESLDELEPSIKCGL